MNGDKTLRLHQIVGNENSCPPDEAYPPLVQGVSVDKQMNNFLNKLKQCSYVYTFSDDADTLGDNVKGKEVKRDCLIEILDYISCSKFLVSHISYKAIVAMVAANLFSSVANDRDNFDPEISQPKFDRDWSHHCFVCEIFLTFMESDEFQVVVGRQYITEEFTGQLFDKLSSEDHRVREAVKSMLHRIYSSIFDRRKFIKTRIKNVLYKFIYEKEVYGGINELMEMVTSIVNGFALPIRHENVEFIRRILIPIHSCQTLTVFHDHVANCMSTLIAKQDTLATIIIPGILKLWPKNHENKVMLFLAELELILELLSPEQFRLIMVPLFQRFAKVIENNHFFNSEKVLYMFNVVDIMNHIERNHDILMPILFPALYSASKTHWNPQIASYIYPLLQRLSDMNPVLYDSIVKNYKQSVLLKVRKEINHKERWRTMDIASKCDEAERMNIFRQKMSY